MSGTAESDLGRGNMTTAKRLTLLENDREQQSRVLTELITKAQEVLTPEQLTSIVRSAVREELADAGLRLGGEDHQDEARADFRFMRNLRKTWEGSVNKVGSGVLLAIVAIVGTIFGLGFWAWISRGSGQ